MSKKAPAPPSDPLAYFIHGQRFYACDCALMHEGFDLICRTRSAADGFGQAPCSPLLKKSKFNGLLRLF